MDALLPLRAGAAICHFLAKPGISACGLTFTKFDGSNTMLWLCTSPGHRELGSPYTDDVNCEACKPGVVDRKLSRPAWSHCEDCGVEFDEEKNLTRVIGGDAVIRCSKCDADRLHPALKR